MEIGLSGFRAQLEYKGSENKRLAILFRLNILSKSTELAWLE
jgi:hypothetical protein